MIMVKGEQEAERHDEGHNVGQASRLSSGWSAQLVRECWGAALRARPGDRRDACPTLPAVATRSPQQLERAFRRKDQGRWGQRPSPATAAV